MIHINLSRSRIAVLLVAFSLVVSAGGAMAASPTIDSETAITTSTSELTDGTTIQNFSANNSEVGVLQASYDSQNPEVRVLDPDGDVIKTFTNASDSMTQTGTDTGTYYYNTSVNHSVWEEVEIDPGQERNVTLRAVNNSEVTNPDTTNVTVTLAGVEGRTVRVVGDSLGDDVLSVNSAGITIPFTSTSYEIPYIAANDKATFTPDEDVPISGQNSTVEYNFKNETSVNAFSAVAEDLDASTWADGIAIQSDEGPIKTYIGEAPDDVEGETYAVYETDANDLVLHTGEDYEGETTIEGLTINSNAGSWTQFQVYGLEAFGVGSLF